MEQKIKAIAPEQIRRWRLDALKEIKEYGRTSQKFIDTYIADKFNEYIRKHTTITIEFDETNSSNRVD